MVASGLRQCYGSGERHHALHQHLRGPTTFTLFVAAPDLFSSGEFWGTCTLALLMALGLVYQWITTPRPKANPLFIWRLLYDTFPAHTRRLRFTRGKPEGEFYLHGVAYTDGSTLIYVRPGATFGEVLITALHEYAHHERRNGKHDRAFLTTLCRLFDMMFGTNHARLVETGHVTTERIQATEDFLVKINDIAAHKTRAHLSVRARFHRGRGRYTKENQK